MLNKFGTLRPITENATDSDFGVNLYMSQTRPSYQLRTVLITVCITVAVNVPVATSPELLISTPEAMAGIGKIIAVLCLVFAVVSATESGTYHFRLVTRQM